MFEISLEVNNLIEYALVSKKFIEDELKSGMIIENSNTHMFLKLWHNFWDNVKDAIIFLLENIVFLWHNIFFWRVLGCIGGSYVGQGHFPNKVTTGMFKFITG